MEIDYHIRVNLPVNGSLRHVICDEGSGTGNCVELKTKCEIIIDDGVASCKGDGSLHNGVNMKLELLGNS